MAYMHEELMPSNSPLRLEGAALTLMLTTLVLSACVNGARARPVHVVDTGSSRAATNAYRLVSIDGADGAIVPREMAADYGITLHREPAEIDGAYVLRSASGFFTPALTDVARAEGLLESFIERKKWPCESDAPCYAREPPLSQRYHRYTRQWVGFIDNGKRKLYGNFFCATFDVDWTHSPVDFVKDGGDCFFKVVFDLDSLEYETFEAHGEA